MAMHGVNPRTGLASAVIGTNHFDNLVTQTVEFTKADRRLIKPGKQSYLLKECWPVPWPEPSAR